MQLKLLFEAKIGAENVYVIEDSRLGVDMDSGGLLGDSVQMPLGIVIRLAPGWTASTLLHELLHAAAFAMGVKLKERDVLCLEFALGGMINSEPAMAKVLFEGLLGGTNPSLAELVGMDLTPEPEPATEVDPEEAYIGQ